MSIDTTTITSTGAARARARRPRTDDDGSAARDEIVPSPLWRSLDGIRGPSGGRPHGGTRRRWVRRILSLGVAVGVVTGLVLSTPSSDYTVTEAPVVGFDDRTRQLGESTLIRHDDGVEGWLHTTGLGPREAVTLWWVIFNDPARCSLPGCGEDDVVDPEVADVVVGLAGGAVAGSDGSISLAFATDAGAALEKRRVGSVPGLLSSRDAEIHLVVRSHRPDAADPSDQLVSFDGECVGECTDVQFTVHQPGPRSTR